MSAATNYDIILVNRIWALLEASADFKALVKAGNRIKETLKRGEGARTGPETRPSKQSADLSEVDIDLGAFSSKVYSNTVTFGNCSRIEEHRQTLILTITTDDVGLVVASQVKAEIVAALKAGGRNLGIAPSTMAVTGWEFDGQHVKNPPARDTGNVLRRQLKMNLVMTYRISS